MQKMNLAHIITLGVVILGSSFTSADLPQEQNAKIEEKETMYDQHFLAAGTRERQKRAGLGLLERLVRKV